jgi:hypothetical protein
MTAKELIETLEEILDERDGEDLDVRMDIDFERVVRDRGRQCH